MSTRGTPRRPVFWIASRASRRALGGPCPAVQAPLRHSTGKWEVKRGTSWTNCRFLLDRRVAATLRLLHRNSGDHGLTLSAIAVSLSVSTSRLRHLVKLETGVCFSEHLNKARVRAAAGYLFDTSLSVKEVAFLVGYYNIWALERHFKTVFGCTPKVYRAQQRTPETLESPAYPRCEMDRSTERRGASHPSGRYSQQLAQREYSGGLGQRAGGDS